MLLLPPLWTGPLKCVRLCLSWLTPSGSYLGLNLSLMLDPRIARTLAPSIQHSRISQEPWSCRKSSSTCLLTSGSWLQLLFATTSRRERSCPSLLALGFRLRFAPGRPLNVFESKLLVQSCACERIVPFLPPSPAACVAHPSRHISYPERDSGARKLFSHPGRPCCFSST